MDRTQQAQVIVFRRSNGVYEFLMLHRQPDKGAFWQPVAGGVEPEDNDSILAAAYREVEEETGITKKDVLAVIKDVHEFRFDTHYITGEPITPITEYVFAFEVRPNVSVTIDIEHDDWQWVDYHTAYDMLKWENNKDGYEKLRKILKISEDSRA